MSDIDKRWAGKDSMERFIDHIEILNNGCWQWLGSLSTSGYGKHYIGSTQFFAHRFSYTIFNNEIPKNLHIDHLCRNRGCVNPEHLEAVTRKTNILRGNGATAINNRKKYCKNGHPFIRENISKVPNGKRCKICYNSWMLNRYHQKRSNNVAVG